MGFTKDKIVQTITVALVFQVTDGKGGSEDAVVKHTFRRPTIKEREVYRQMAHKFEKGKPQLRLTKANLALWDACIVSVEGYDDLPAGDFKPYFLEDDFGKEHAEAAARHMLDKITEEEADLEKNSD